MNIPWKKVGEVVMLVIAGASAVAGVISDHEKETKFKNMEKDLEMLKTKVKDS